jgi:hypothetical protein
VRDLLKVLLLAIALFGQTSAVHAVSVTPCFAPLDNPTLHDPDLFKDIYQRKAVGGKTPGFVRFLPIEGGKNDGNIDFYYIDFVPRAGQTPKSAFKEIRLHFSDFAAGTANEYAFGPYRSTLDSNDEVLQANKNKWELDDPTGALMTFNLDTPFPESFLYFYKAQPGRVTIMEKAGDVRVICASETDFVFATVETEVGRTHPVAGNRAFGLKDMGNGTFRFYSKAADRESDSAPNHITPGIFCKGHKFWISFYAAMRTYLNRSGMPAKEDANLENHGPVPYPFHSGDQPKLKCD